MRAITLGVVAALLFCLSGYAADSKGGEEIVIKELEDYQKQAETMLQQLQKLQGAGAGTTADQARAKVMQLAFDDNFLQSASALWKHPDRNKALAIQAGFFLLMILLKAWVQSRIPHWFKRLLVGFFFTILAWLGVALVIPFFVLGEPFRVFTFTLLKVLFS